MKNLLLLLLTLAWDYPEDRTNIVFEVWGSPSITEPAWMMLGTTPELRWPFEPTCASGFFKVRARDEVTGLVSDWSK